MSDNELEKFCKINRIKSLSIFGSYQKNISSDQSDLDILVEFDENSEYGLPDIARLEREITELTGKKVDLHTPAELSPYFRNEVIKEAVVKYGEKR